MAFLSLPARSGRPPRTPSSITGQSPWRTPHLEHTRTLHHCSDLLPLHPIRLCPHLHLPLGAAAVARVVDLQRASVHDLLRQLFLGLGRALNVNEISVRETSGLPRAAVDGDSDVEDVADAAEEVCGLSVLPHQTNELFDTYHSSHDRSSGSSCYR